MLWQRFFGYNAKCKKLLRQLPDNPAANALYSKPYPEPKIPSREVEYVVIDLETTGLDASTATILSIGLVHLRGSYIDLATARHYYIAQSAPITPSSVTIHGITDTHIAVHGQPLASVLTEIVPQIAGKVLLAHHAKIERTFLHNAFTTQLQLPWITPVVDTQYLAQRQKSRGNIPIHPNSLRLANLRREFGLPDYQAHNALSDAVATAELFLAQRHHISPRRDIPLRDLLSR